MKLDLDMLGVLWMVYGAFQALVALAIGLLYGGMGGLFGLIGASEGDEEALVMGVVFIVIAAVVVVIALVFAALPIAAGIGIRKRKPWGRIAGFVAGALSLLNMPLGTLLGVFTFVTLTDAEVAEEFALV